MNQDPFTLEIVKDALVAIGYEMFDAMIRTSMSPIIYETTDFAVGVMARAISSRKATASRPSSRPSIRRCNPR
jgi:N-methylhydantoinase B/oxoprolinase/acetone carboxylase alpha subunit